MGIMIASFFLICSINAVLSWNSQRFQDLHPARELLQKKANLYQNTFTPKDANHNPSKLPITNLHWWEIDVKDGGSNTDCVKMCQGDESNVYVSTHRCVVTGTLHHHKDQHYNDVAYCNCCCYFPYLVNDYF